MTNRILSGIMIGFLLFIIPALGGLDQPGSSGANGAENLSINSLAQLGLQDDITNAPQEDVAPQAVATGPMNDVAVYTSSIPPVANQKKLISFNINSKPPMYLFYKGSSLMWNNFISTFPSNTAGLWIERANGWTWYSTMPLGGWTQELLYVPVTSPVTMYEVYSGGFMMKYNLGTVAPGYYTIWYYADMPGRHYNVFTTNSGNSNTVIVDVYSVLIQTKPTPKPDPKAECLKNVWCRWDDDKGCSCNLVCGGPECYWDFNTRSCVCPNSEKEKCESQKNADGKQMCFWDDAAQQCRCTGIIDDQKATCEKDPKCHWDEANQKCDCVEQPAPNPVAECEKDSNCHWADGRCQCNDGPVPNPVSECESNPTCDYVDGHCYCRGVNDNPEPTPSPNPNPEPIPSPTPTPEPSPTRCSSGCYWDGSQCVCMGLHDGGQGADVTPVASTNDAAISAQQSS